MGGVSEAWLFAVFGKHALEGFRVEIRAIFQAVLHWTAAEKLESFHLLSAVGFNLHGLAHTIVAHAVPEKLHCGAREKVCAIPRLLDVPFKVGCSFDFHV
jgi:hypothetical protein